ncbi:MAG: cytochrome c3 family protein [Steroidobacteraceae bacterium]
MPVADHRIGIGWEIAQVLGLAAAAGCLLLLLLTVRRRADPAHSQPLSLRRHELIGWLVLFAAVVHVSLLVIVDRRVIEHLKLTAPIYEWAGIAALLLLIVLTPLSVSRFRESLWRNHRRFQAVHVSLACVLIPALAAHVVTTSHFVHGGIRVAGFLTLSVAALLGLLRMRARPSPAAAPASSRPATRLVFGRHSRKIALLAVAASGATAGLLSAGAVVELRQPVIARSTALKVDFPHDKHRQVECVECHHNFADKTGSGSCYACHRSGRADLHLGAEARFHGFCLGCHRNPRPSLTRHGPVTGCSTCHVP